MGQGLLHFIRASVQIFQTNGRIRCSQFVEFAAGGLELFHLSIDFRAQNVKTAQQYRIIRCRFSGTDNGILVTIGLRGRLIKMDCQIGDRDWILDLLTLTLTLSNSSTISQATRHLSLPAPWTAQVSWASAMAASTVCCKYRRVNTSLVTGREADVVGVEVNADADATKKRKETANR
jgi:hypothetical protein